MLPKSFVEKQIRFFKFWLNHQLQDGLHYQNELFRCIRTADAANRSQLYRLGYQLAQQGADILVTHRQHQCQLWVSLRSQPKARTALQSCWAAPSFVSSELKTNQFISGADFSRRQNVFSRASKGGPELVDSKRKVMG